MFSFVFLPFSLCLKFRKGLISRHVQFIELRIEIQLFRLDWSSKAFLRQSFPGKVEHFAHFCRKVFESQYQQFLMQ